MSRAHLCNKAAPSVAVNLKGRGMGGKSRLEPLLPVHPAIITCRIWQARLAYFLFIFCPLFFSSSFSPFNFFSASPSISLLHPSIESTHFYTIQLVLFLDPLHRNAERNSCQELILPAPLAITYYLLDLRQPQLFHHERASCLWCDWSPVSKSDWLMRYGRLKLESSSCQRDGSGNSSPSRSIQQTPNRFVQRKFFIRF